MKNMVNKMVAKNMQQIIIFDNRDMGNMNKKLGEKSVELIEKFGTGATVKSTQSIQNLFVVPKPRQAGINRKAADKEGQR